MFRLAHISDIHLGPLPQVRGRDLLSKRITGYINWHRNRTKANQPNITRDLLAYLSTLQADHTVITGDLINLGLDQEIRNARSWLEQLGSPIDHTVVLGNHDAYVRGARNKVLNSWQDWVTGDNRAFIGGDKDYPIIRRRGLVSIIGCNSARASAPFLATGYFKKDQGDRLARILKQEQESGQFCLLLIHHAPFEKATAKPKRLLGLKNILKAVSDQGADLILHGHTHQATTNEIDGKNKQVPVICVPAAYQWSGHKNPPAGINLFEISKNGNNWQIEFERHGYMANGSNEIGLISSQILR